MLGKSAQSEKRLDAAEPGPGYYVMPSGFKLPGFRKQTGPTESRKKPADTGKISKEELLKEMHQHQLTELKSRKKHAHFGTSTRDGIALERWDTDEGIRETHNPNLKHHDRNSLRMRTQTTPGPGTYNF